MDILAQFSNFDNYTKVIYGLDLNKVYDNEVLTLSGGELQRLLCAIHLIKKGMVYIFDEPTNYLDIEYRMKLANLIKDLNDGNRYIFVLEHDLSILDFLADYIHIIYGEPSAYGVISTLYAHWKDKCIF